MGTWFLSYNSADKDAARMIGAHLLAQAVNVWLDEWRIGPGRSIVHEVNVGLEQADGIFVLWSRNAAKSTWVQRELSFAVARMISDSKFQLVPLLLDNTPLPALIKDVSYINWKSDRAKALEQILGVVGKKDVGRRGILMGLNNLIQTLEARVFSAVPVVACERCGSEDLREFTAEDESRGDTYFCIECQECGWQDGGEI